MYFLRDYISTMSGYVRSMMNKQFNEPGLDSSTDIANEPGKEITLTSDDSNTEHIPANAKLLDTGMLEWLHKLKTQKEENPLVYCINSLASLGSDVEKSDSPKTWHSLDVENTVVIEQAPDTLHANIQPPDDVDADVSTKEKNSDMGLSHWFSGLSSRSEVWQQMKEDFSEVVNFVSVEPKDAASRTASSVRQHLSAVASVMGKIDPHRFTLLPQPESLEDVGDQKSATPSSPPPGMSDFPSLATLRSDVGQLFSGVVSGLFSLGEATSTPVKNKREARLHILRADPATYELEPPSPPAHLGLHSYADWRSAYFDEVRCQPLPGIPLCGARDTSNTEQNVEDLLEPSHPSPEELLEQNPFMRTYLSQLVRIDDQRNSKGITDADFWSRYYYRVWLLDVTEKRRQRLALRMESKTRSTMSSSSTYHSHQSVQLPDVDSDDWFGDSDTEVDNHPDWTGSHVDHHFRSSSSQSACELGDSSHKSLSPKGKGNKRVGKKSNKRGYQKRQNDHDKHIETRSRVTQAPKVSESPIVGLLDRTTSNSAGASTQALSSNVACVPVGITVCDVVESDDAAISTSSVVVINSTEYGAKLSTEPQQQAVNAQVTDERQTIGSTVECDDPPTALDTSSDDWGEVCMEDMAELSLEQVAATTNPANNEPDDWEDWS